MPSPWRPVMARRVRGLAPVAVNVRTSPAASPRISPTDIATMASARAAPTIVVQRRTAASVSWSSRASTRSPTSAATAIAASICSSVSASGNSANHVALAVAQPCSAIADGVTSAKGADEYAGSSTTCVTAASPPGSGRMLMAMRLRPPGSAATSRSLAGSIDAGSMPKNSSASGVAT